MYLYSRRTAADRLAETRKVQRGAADLRRECGGCRPHRSLDFPLIRPFSGGRRWFLYAAFVVDSWRDTELVDAGLQRTIHPNDGDVCARRHAGHGSEHQASGAQLRRACPSRW